jgi:hypothetical protein
MKNKRTMLFFVVAVIFFMAGCATVKNNDTQSQDTDQKQQTPEEYRLGGQGPGGGIIFYDDLIGFDFDGDGVIAEDEKNLLQYSYLTDCRFLEAAPKGWNLPVTKDDPFAQWGGDEVNIAEIVDVEINLLDPEPKNIRETVGNGRRNTELILSYLNENTGEEGTAAHLCSNYNGGGLSNWFLPSVGELVILYYMMDEVGGISFDDYTSSSESMFNNLKWIVDFGEDRFGVDTRRKYKEDRVRPIRAF